MSKKILWVYEKMSVLYIRWTLNIINRNQCQSKSMNASGMSECMEGMMYMSSAPASST